MRGRRYTDDERAAALEQYAELGQNAAARATGIPGPTLTRWARAAGVVSRSTENHRAEVEALTLTFAELRHKLAVKMLHIADRLADQTFVPCTVIHWTRDGECMEKQLDEPTFADKQKILTSTAIAVDKALLLAGESVPDGGRLAVQIGVQVGVREDLAERLGAMARRMAPEAIDVAPPAGGNGSVNGHGEPT